MRALLRTMRSFRGGEGEFGRCAGLAQTLVEGSEDGVTASSDEGGHVKAAAHGTPAAEDGALALERAAVAIEGGQTSQSGSFAPIELTQFGHLGQEERGGARSNSDDGGELARFARELLVLLDRGRQERFDLSDLFSQLVGKAMIEP